MDAGANEFGDGDLLWSAGSGVVAPRGKSPGSARTLVSCALWTLLCVQRTQPTGAGISARKTHSRWLPRSGDGGERGTGERAGDCGSAGVIGPLAGDARRISKNLCDDELLFCAGWNRTGFFG